ncbi:hypothetical protein N185_28730 [Sinorhizobium sp. GW3]|jgi:hypothetical protein|nr:hypothetical protein N185_28730 [Sinorhizobium sp. GW3]
MLCAETPPALLAAVGELVVRLAFGDDDEALGGELASSPA